MLPWRGTGEAGPAALDEVEDECALCEARLTAADAADDVELAPRDGCGGGRARLRQRRQAPPRVT
jgi:hypothetical protein